MSGKPIFSRILSRKLGKNLQQIRTKVLRGNWKRREALTESYRERVKQLEEHDRLSDRVNIGYPETKVKLINTVEFRKLRDQKNLLELERKARKRELNVNIEGCTKESFLTDRQQSVKTIAEHYGIYRDLYRNAYFYPQIPLDVLYRIEDQPDEVNPVFYGNILPPLQVKSQPDVLYPAENDRLYTLCMTALDSNLQDKNTEYLHWMVGNIPGSNIEAGELLCDYLVPFPVKGTGLHRYVFVLYIQEDKVDFSKDLRSKNCTSLRERSFESFDFLQRHQDSITPVGLSFFQSEYDESVRDTFHNILGMDEPRYDFYPPQTYVPKQKLWPIREPFNIYMDRYRDKKDIEEEVLIEKLNNADAFTPRQDPKKYPNIYRIGNDVPSWLKLKLTDKRLRRSYWKKLDD